MVRSTYSGRLARVTASISSFRLGLRAKLSLAIAAGLIAITSSGAYLVWRMTSAQIYRELGGYHHDLVRQVAANLDGKLRIARTSLERIALAAPPGIADQPDAMQRYIEDKPVMLGFVDRIVVLSNSGEIVAHVPLLKSVRGHSMADAEYFRHVLRTRKPYVSKPFRGPDAGQPVVHVAVPYLSEQGELKLVSPRAIPAQSGLHRPGARTELGEDRLFRHRRCRTARSSRTRTRREC